MHFSNTFRDHHSKKAQPLVRPIKDRVFAGVCAGMADHLNISRFWTRVILVVVALLQFPLAFLFYIIAIFVIPSERKLAGNMPCTFTPPPPPSPSAAELVESEIDLETLNRQFNAIEAKIRLLEDHVTSKEYILRRKFEELN